MGIGSCIVARGLAPWPSGFGALPRIRGWGYGPYHRAGVQGPKDLGTPYCILAPLDSCLAPENESRMTRAGDFSGSSIGSY